MEINELMMFPELLLNELKSNEVLHDHFAAIDVNFMNRMITLIATGSSFANRDLTTRLNYTKDLVDIHIQAGVRKEAFVEFKKCLLAAYSKLRNSDDNECCPLISNMCLLCDDISKYY